MSASELEQRLAELRVRFMSLFHVRNSDIPSNEEASRALLRKYTVEEAGDRLREKDLTEEQIHAYLEHLRPSGRWYALDEDHLITVTEDGRIWLLRRWDESHYYAQRYPYNISVGGNRHYRVRSRVIDDQIREVLRVFIELNDALVDAEVPGHLKRKKCGDELRKFAVKEV
jgi:hypothetical protein